MFKLVIWTEDGRKLQLNRDNFIYYRDAEGRDRFWEWEHIQSNSSLFDPIFRKARQLMDEAAGQLPDGHMSGLR